MLDWSISVGNILTILSVIGSVITLVYSMKNDISVLKRDIYYLQDSHKALTEAFNQLGKILTQVAVQDQRINMLERRVEDLAHGRGLVT